MSGSGQHSTEMATGEEKPAPLALRHDESFRREMEPHSLDALEKMAARLHKIALCGVKSPEEAMVRMLTGRELGLTAMQAMRGVYVVEGNPSLSANLKQAVCLAHPSVCEQFEHISSDDTHAHYRVKRRGQPVKDFTYTIENAKTAQLVDRGSDPKKNNWNRHPRRMLQARAKGEAADVVFGDLLLGLPSREELEDERDTRPPPEQAPPGHVEVVSARPTVDAAPRNIDLELEALKAEIAAANTPELRKGVREKIRAFVADVGNPWGEIAGKFFNTCWTAHKSPGAEQATAATDPATAPPVTP